MSTPGDLLGALGREARARLGGRSGDSQARVYRGRSIEELIPRIQRELGADAIVTRRREGLTGGVLGFFQHPWVEIEAVASPPSLDLYDEADDATPPLVSELTAQQQAAAGQPAPGQTPPGQIAPVYAQPGQMPPGYAQPRQMPPGYAPPGGSAIPAPGSYAAPPQGAYAAPPPGAYAAPPQGGYAAPSPPIAPHQGLGVGLQPERAALFAQEAGAGGSAYVTAHLAALARANRERLEERALFARPEPLAPPPPPRPAASAAPGAVGTPFASAPRTVTQTQTQPAPAAAPLPREGFEAAIDFDELLAAPAASEAAAAAQPGAPSRPANERRTVPPGSGDRARAGVEKGLERYGVANELAQELIATARAHVLPLAPRSGLAAAVRTAIAERIPVAPALPRQGAAIVLVGAGGAGKTTCCAALLKAYRAGSTLPAAFATVLREPVHGELQLLLHPLLVKPAPLDSPRAVRALRRARGEGLVVIDTPRLSPADRGGIKRLGRMLAELAPERIVVAVPATLGRGAATQLLDALEPLQANAMALTHGDETDQLGAAVEAASRFGLAPEYMLDRGQSGNWRLTRLEPPDLAAMVLR